MITGQLAVLHHVSDASLVLLKKLDLFQTVIPSKIFESMAMGKPIVLGVQGEVKDIIEEAGCGICIQPEDAGELAQAICRLADDPGLQHALGDSGEAYVKRHFDRAQLAQQYEQLLQQAATKPNVALTR